MSDLLSIGASGLKAYRGALATISDNISNAETAGYARRDVRLVELSGAGIGNKLYRGSVATAAGGVMIASVSRAWDDFKAADSRVALSDSARSDAKVRWLQAAENALPFGDDGTASKLADFFGSATRLAADPNGWLPRQEMLNSLGRVTTAIKSDAAALARVSSGIADASGVTVTSLNGNLAALAEVNNALSRVNPGSASQASLMDQRDQLIDTISGDLAVNVTLDTRGIATLTVAGASAVELVNGTAVSQVARAVATDGTISLSVTGASTVAIGAAGGSLAGLVDSAATVATERGALDTLATDFVTQVNAWNANGRTGAGVAGGALLSITGGAAGLAVATADPAAIAAASADGTANGNLIDLSSMRGTNGAEARLSVLTLGAAAALNNAKAEQAATNARRDSALAYRSETSGVDLDREAAELIRYQQAFDGAARIVQVARETMQTIMSIF